MGDTPHAHITHESVHGDVVTPGHAPRVETPAYRHARHLLVVELDTPCYICGVRHSQGGRLEAHHAPIERSILEACDWRKVHEDFPQVTSHDTLEAFVDSAANLLVLCHDCHVGTGRGRTMGIHHCTYPAWIAQRYLRAGYILFAQPGRERAAEQADDALGAQGAAVPHDPSTCDTPLS